MHLQRLWLLRFLCYVWIVMQYTTLASEWNYDEEGPDVWKEHNPTCGGSAQSPINIARACTRFRRYSRFRLSANYFKKLQFKLLNNGHSIVGVLVNQNTTLLSFTGGGLPGTHAFVNLHFHWGENHASGSEHRVDGNKYAAELHVVHANTQTNKLAVLGFLIHTIVGEDSSNDSVSHAWKQYFDAAAGLSEINQSTTIGLSLGALLHKSLRRYWRYQGSLTTPPCTEGVTWTVFEKPIEFSDENIHKLRESVISHNARDPQPLRGRRVYRSFWRSGAAGRCRACG